MPKSFWRAMNEQFQQFFYFREMKKLAMILMLLTAGLFLTYFLGPRVKYDSVAIPDDKTYDIEEIESMIRKQESSITNLLPDNAARIVWADSAKVKSEYVLLYMHGFSAGHEEGNPLHVEFASRYNCNLYLPRFSKHGLDDIDAFKGITPQEMLASAKEALDVAKTLGDKIILMNVSTGATTGLYLASVDKDIVATINLSPNIDIAGEMDALLVGPWGRQLAKHVFGGNYNIIEYSDEQARFWYPQYHIDGLLALKSLIGQTMVKETFEKIDQPCFLGYYFKDEENQDNVVSVPDMLRFYENIGTPDNLKRKVAFPNGRHVMSSKWIPSEEKEALTKQVFAFADEVLGLKMAK